jgi:Pyrimidine 5''-nucleotidase (UMPH-1).
MIHINKVFKRVNPEESYILLDYDRTVTTHDSTTTWGMLTSTSLVSDEYKIEHDEVYNKYRKEEIKSNTNPQAKFKLMDEWAKAALDSVYKYHIYEDTINRIMLENHGMTLRRDSRNFLENMHLLGIPVIIISAGLGVFIEKYLEQQYCLFDNITIYSNFFIYENGRIVSVKQPMLHSANKNLIDYSFELGNRPNGILIGDQIEDIKTRRGRKVQTIGFCDTDTYDLKDYNRNFDITLTGKSDFDNVGKLLIKGYK